MSILQKGMLLRQAKKEEEFVNMSNKSRKTALLPSKTTVTHISPFETKLSMIILSDDVKRGNAQAREDMAKLFILIAAAHDEVDYKLEEWYTYLASYTELLFPTVIDGLPNTTTDHVSNEDLHNLRTAISALEEILPPGAEDDNPFDPNFPSTKADNQVKLARRMSHDILHGLIRKWKLPLVTITYESLALIFYKGGIDLFAHYSLFAYLVGRTYGDRTVLQMQDRRPKAVQGKYNEANPIVTMAGALRPDQSVYKPIIKTWSLYNTFRARCVTEFARFSSPDAPLGSSIVYVGFKLNRYAGMGSYPILESFLLRYLFVFSMGALKEQTTFFTACLSVLLELDEEERPYDKLKRGDTSRLFNSADLEDLVGLACMVAVEEDPGCSLKDFTYKQVPILKAQFDRLRNIMDEEMMIHELAAADDQEDMEVQ